MIPFLRLTALYPHPGAGSDVFYSEDGMTFIAVNHPHYLFLPEDSSLFDPAKEKLIPDDAPKFLMLNPNPLALTGEVVRMIYDPDKDGVPNRFNLVGLEVKSGGALKVHAEVDYSGVNGAVYGPLSEGSWGTTGPKATGLLFVDLNKCYGECSNGRIDNIVFEPSVGTGPTATCNGIRATIVGTPGDDTFSGTALPDVVHGLGGNDTITAFVGNDKLNGGAGSDSCDGGRHINGDTATACETKTNIP